jgi:2-haloalkanoic acid dehalogenase type II
MGPDQNGFTSSPHHHVTSVRAVCFDLDNTLWDIWPVIPRAEGAMHAFLAERYPRVTDAFSIEALRARRMDVAARFPEKGHDYSFLRVQSLREIAEEIDCPPVMADEAFEIFLTARNAVDVYAEVIPALELLKRRYRLFTASNGNADLVKIGLAQHFERSIAARHVGVLKPDPAVFRKVVESTDLALADVVYVGDDPEHDVEGARRAGMHAIWMNRTGASWPAEYAPPAHTVTSLTELVVLLRCE